MACSCLPELKVILWIKCTGRKDLYESYCALFGPCCYWVIEGAPKITSLTGALALQPDRLAITYCCGSTCWKVRVWVRKEYHSKTRCFSYPLTALFASVHGTGCAMCLYATKGVDVSGWLDSKVPSPCLKGNMLLVVINMSVTPAPSAGWLQLHLWAQMCFLSSSLLLFWLLPESCRILSELQSSVKCGAQVLLASGQWSLSAFFNYHISLFPSVFPSEFSAWDWRTMQGRER